MLQSKNYVKTLLLFVIILLIPSINVVEAEESSLSLSVKVVEKKPTQTINDFTFDYINLGNGEERDKRSNYIQSETMFTPKNNICIMMGNLAGIISEFLLYIKPPKADVLFLVCSGG